MLFPIPQIKYKYEKACFTVRVIGILKAEEGQVRLAGWQASWLAML